MNIAELKNSRFLKKEDCGENGIIATIEGDVTMENMAKDGAPEELRPCLHFAELEKPLVLNTTNAGAIARIVGSDETSEWHGHQVVLYNDPNVGYAGKITGGIRIRAARNASPAAPKRRSPVADVPTPRPRPAATKQAAESEPADNDVPY